MNRSNYVEDQGDLWAVVRWRGAVKSAIRGARGQQFLFDLIAGLDALPEKKLIGNQLEVEGEFCALGVVAHRRGIDIKEYEFPENQYDIDDCHHERIANALDIADALGREAMFVNDDSWYYSNIPERAARQRYQRVYDWAAANIKKRECESCGKKFTPRTADQVLCEF